MPLTVTTLDILPTIVYICDMEFATKETTMKDVLSITIDRATKAARDRNETAYVVPTYDGPRITFAAPYPTVSFYRVSPNGSVECEKYEPWA